MTHQDDTHDINRQFWKDRLSSLPSEVRHEVIEHERAWCLQYGWMEGAAILDEVEDTLSKEAAQ